MTRKLLIRLLIGAVTGTTSAGCVVPEQRYNGAVESLQSEQAAHRATTARFY
jgi:hypothetical protein